MQKPELQEDYREAPAWIPPPPPQERQELIPMLMERYGFLAACVATVLGLGLLFLYPNLLLNDGARQAPLATEGSGSTAVGAAQLTITSSPSNATVWIDGDSLGRTPIVDYPVSQGRYLLSLQRADHASVDTVVYLAQGTATSFFFALPRQGSPGLTQQRPPTTRPPVVQVTPPQPRATEPPPQAASTPPRQPETPPQRPQVDPPPSNPATQEVDDVPPAQNPDPVAEPASPSPATGLQGEAVDTAEEGLSTPVPQQGELQISSQPSGASVLLGDEMLGITPLRTTVPAGSPTLTLQLEGYDPFTATVEVSAGQIRTLNGVLSEQLGTLKILAKPWGSIYVDGQLRENESNVWYTERLAGGSYRVKVEHPSLGKWERIIDIVPGQETEIVADLNPKING